MELIFVKGILGQLVSPLGAGYLVNTVVLKRAIMGTPSMCRAPKSVSENSSLTEKRR